MQDAFSMLTAGIAFKSKQAAVVKNPSVLNNESIEQPVKIPETGNAEEAANLQRKRLKTRVQGQNAAAPIQEFAELRPQLSDDIAASLTEQKYLRPTPVQAQVLPLLLQGRDVITISATGTGKSLAFLLPILSSAGVERKTRGGVHAVILVPSRELAQQLQREASRLCSHTKLRTVVLTKATATGEDFTKVDLVIATPLRLCRLLKLRQLPLNTARYLVLDEADKLLQQKELATSFLKQIDTIVAACQQKNKTLVISIFSATIPEQVEVLVRTIQKDVVRVTVGSRNATSPSVSQRMQYVGSEDGKFLRLQDMIQAGLQAPVLIFVSSSEGAVMLQKRLMAESLAVECIYASQDHAQRTSAFAAFRSGKVWILVTTDLLARGIDFIGVKTVINYDCPKSLQDYVHRVGRTGRASQSGMAVTFFTEGDTEMVRPIANLIKEAGQPVPEWMLLKNHRSREVDAKRTHKPKRLRTK